MKAFLLAIIPLLMILVFEGLGQGLSLSCDDGHGGSVMATWQHPLPQGNTLRDLCVVDSRTGWAVGDFGTILRTTDEGETWTAHDSGTKQKLCSISFGSRLHGWTCGASVLLRSEDGGLHWRELDFPGKMESTALLAVRALSSQSVLLLTNDGVWKSTDSGQRWARSHEMSTPLAMFFLDSLHGWVTGNRGRVARTTDGGKSWFDHWVITDGAGMNAVRFPDSLQGWAGDDSTLYESIDGGVHWQRQFSDEDRTSVVFFPGKKISYKINASRGLLRSTDRGASWMNFATGDSILFRSASFPSPDSGWAVGTGGIFHTTDAGLHWATQAAHPNVAMNRVFFLDTRTGWIVGDSGRIFSTADAGQHWHARLLADTNDLYDVFFLDADRGWIAGKDGMLMRTTNGGATWIRTAVPVTTDIHRITFADDASGFCIGSAGVLLTTNDGGASWKSMTFGRNTHLADIAIADTNAICILAIRADSTALVLRSIDGALTWIPASLPKRNDPVALRFSNPGHGLLLTRRGELLVTADGGEHWRELPTPLSAWSADIAAISPRRAVIFGTQGAIIRIDWDQ